jgi:hypothetical protein
VLVFFELLPHRVHVLPVWILGLLTAPVFWSAVHAEPVADGESSSWVDRWLQGPGMTGDWFGTRTSLTALGVTPSMLAGLPGLSFGVSGNWASGRDPLQQHRQRLRRGTGLRRD